MGDLNKTALNEHHVKLGANMVEFGGWEMPLHYETGIVQEHLITRREAGLFDISHMGRFTVRGKDALEFLQHVLSNNAAALEEEEGHYTMIPNENGGVIDDAYLYRFVPEEYILVVNASNRVRWSLPTTPWSSPCSACRGRHRKRSCWISSPAVIYPNRCATV